MSRDTGRSPSQSATGRKSVHRAATPFGLEWVSTRLFVQPAMKRISAVVDGTQAPAGPGSFMMLNYIWSDPHPLTERIRENVGMLNGYAP